MSDDRSRARRADLWRAGLLDPGEARRFEQDMQFDSALAAQAGFGARTAQALNALPRLAARRVMRRAPRRARWARLAAAGAVSASLAGLLVFGVGGLPGEQLEPTAQPSAQTADAVQNMEFYEWLATHPTSVESVGEHDEG
ncbi:hypothetical protein GALL_284830 [mine drainage metagenome]|jgi:hypothetical protein|uniref:Uncharacterized protein n=1 Tax=mine drainage metagenome TaxID=410659 RepID=A0A1J5RBY9_9ZZZZ